LNCSGSLIPHLQTRPSPVGFEIMKDLKPSVIPKGKMTIGVVAAREYETANPELAELLHQISWALDHME
jgi:ABC-type proline/glycine betaine transport system substrate-binding protein